MGRKTQPLCRRMKSEEKVIAPKLGAWIESKARKKSATEL
jgi:hypothetical protein